MKKHHHSRTHSRKAAFTQTSLPWVLYGLALVMLVATGTLVVRYGPTAYFAVTGQPLQLARDTKPAAAATPLPVFAASGAIAQTSLAASDTQTVTINATAQADTKAQIEAWITSPEHKQVWRSPDNAVQQFKAGKLVTENYHYALTAGLPKGEYHVSFIINSPNEFTDYVVNDNFAEFTLN